jgi:hypothetical protein
MFATKKTTPAHICVLSGSHCRVCLPEGRVFSLPHSGKPGSGAANFHNSMRKNQQQLVNIYAT